MKVEAVLFDLDGTVIDSYNGIQSAFDKAYLQVYGTANTVSIKSIIGPPIGEILVRLNKEHDPKKVEAFVSAFKSHYDTSEFKRSTLYEGMEGLLQKLKELGVKQYIATNKRLAATKLILDYLSITNYFHAVYSSDSKQPSYASKQEMVEDILKTESLDPSTMILVGDTYQDEIAAKFNNIRFVYANYGFGTLENVELQISAPLEALDIISYKVTA